MYLSELFARPRWSEASALEARRIASEVRVVDVREPWEFAAAHIAGAENVPLDGLDAACRGWKTDAPLLLVCRSGARSARAAAALAGLGFSRLHNLTGGMLAWEERGYAVARSG